MCKPILGGRLLLRFFTIFLAKFLNTPGSINDFLFAGIERMADRTYFNMQGFAHGRTGLERIAATAGHGYFLIIGMNICFHVFILDLYPSGGVRGTERRVLSFNLKGVATTYSSACADGSIIQPVASNQFRMGGCGQAPGRKNNGNMLPGCCYGIYFKPIAVP